MGARAYLRPEARQRQLLDAASRLFDRGGFAAITMTSVAAEAGASRRLVYDHFDSVGALYEAFFVDRVARYAAAIDVARADGANGSARSITAAVHELLAVPAEDLRAIRLVLADSATPELAAARDALRAHLHARWLPNLGALGVDVEIAAALVWTLASSFVTLADLVHRGELVPAAAESLANAIAASLPDLVQKLTPNPVTSSELA